MKTAAPRHLICLAVLGLLSGCGLFKSIFGDDPPTTGVRSVQVVAEVRANQNNATSLDIVFVYDAKTQTMLPKSAVDWFAQKAMLVNNLADAIDVVSVKVPPIMKTGPLPLPKRYRKALAVYSYANYVTVAGQAMGNITPYRNPVIWLTPGTVVYSDE